MQSNVVVYLPHADHAVEQQQLANVLGVPTYLRSLLALALAGEEHLVVVGLEHQRKPLLKAWRRYASPEYQSRIHFVALDRQGQYTLEVHESLRALVAPEAFVFHASTVITQSWIQQTLRPALKLGHYRGQAGELCPTANYQAILGSFQRCLQSKPSLEARQHCRVHHAPDRRQLERFLCEDIRLSATGAVAMHINKRISLPISKVLARLRISPNTITAFNMLVGLAAGIGTAGVTYFGLLMGAILFQAASVLDGCDGEVAKLTHRTSKFGQLIDTISDNFALVSFFTGLTIHLYRTTGGLSSFLWGSFLFGGYAALIIMMFRFLRKHTDSSSLVTFEKQYFLPLVSQRTGILSAIARIGRPLLKKEWFTMGFLGLAIAGILPFALYISAGVAWIGVGLLLVLPHLPQPAALPEESGATSAVKRRSHA